PLLFHIYSLSLHDALPILSTDRLPDIFISYSWKNKDIADEIDNRFKSVGITMRRDIRDAGYRKSIKEFMQQIRETDFVLMIISEDRKSTRLNSSHVSISYA